MKTTDAKQIIEFNESVCSELHSYVESYVKWVCNNTDREYWGFFGVKEYIKESQFGAFPGFMHNNTVYPCNWGSSFYWGSDFNLYVPATKEYITKDFAKQIPLLIEEGLGNIQKFNAEVSEILKAKIQFTDL